MKSFTLYLQSAFLSCFSNKGVYIFILPWTAQMMQSVRSRHPGKLSWGNEWKSKRGPVALSHGLKVWALYQQHWHHLGSCPQRLGVGVGPSNLTLPPTPQLDLLSLKFERNCCKGAERRTVCAHWEVVRGEHGGENRFLEQGGENGDF